MKIHILGNPLLEHDSLAFKIMPDLKRMFPEHLFVELDPSEEFPEDEELVFIDIVAEGNEVKVLDDIGMIMDEPRYSAHDFGLGSHLKLMKKLMKLNEARIICIPMAMGYEDALLQAADKIRALKPSLS